MRLPCMTEDDLNRPMKPQAVKLPPTPPKECDEIYCGIQEFLFDEGFDAQFYSIGGAEPSDNFRQTIGVIINENRYIVTLIEYDIVVIEQWTHSKVLSIPLHDPDSLDILKRFLYSID